MDPLRLTHMAQGRGQGRIDTLHHGLINQSLGYNNDKSQQLAEIEAMLHNSTGSGH